ncbi:MAG: LacI family transcriptional regulator [Ruminococcus sp.]|nr:LacI family transcriptional regulator [Ruminococcus sp.]MCD7799883.1 LacI family transcriptional regulator [Ruminococcus sp.]
MNISKIAELAKVSPATVSRYLNNGYISEEKKERISKVIKETGYIPSQSAQTLRTKKNYLIGVIVPKINSESISKMVQGITLQLKNTKYNLLLANTDNSTDKELEFLSIFKKSTVDGVILIGTIITKKHHQIIDDYTKPIVILGQFDKDISCVYYDDFGAARGATEKLIRSGCKDIAYIGVTNEDKSAGMSRLDGFKFALEKNHLVINERLIHECDFTSDSGYKCMDRILSMGQRFDGLFCATDNIALGAMKCLKEHNIGVPNYVKIISVGDSNISNLCTPTLSTAHLYYVNGGESACNLLLESLEKDMNMVKHYRLGYEIISRESTMME